MSEYDFLPLSPADLEDLVRDLLQAELGARLESFASGRDRGIDLRHANDRGSSLIVQCKHYARSGFDALLRDLAKKELPKIRSLNPSRYLLATSVRMTPDRKSRLIQTLRPYVLEPADILGCEDLNNLLGRHSEVEARHHKLWLTSHAVMTKVLHNASFLQTEMERNAIRRRLSLYVQTAAFGRATDILDAFNYCIISGIPGIGKTTLAETLIVSLIEQGYELVVATSDILEALNQLRDEKQVIYYDDFLGHSSLGEKMGKNEDRSLIRLITEVRRRRSRKLILTTREYILAQAKRTYELLNDDRIEVGKCIVDLADYTRYDRAKILYNHLFFFEVPEPNIAALLADRRYREIVDHPNFSPRIVEWMTSSLSIAGLAPSDYADEFVANLTSPQRLWRHAFDEQIGSDARQLLYVLGSFASDCPLECLGTVHRAMLSDASVGDRERRFRDALKEILGTFVESSRHGKEHWIGFHNPSIADFVRQDLASNAEMRDEVLRNARYFEQLQELVRLNGDGRIELAPTGLVSEEEIVNLIPRVLLSKSATGITSRSLRAEIKVRSYDPVGKRLDRLSRWGHDLGAARIHRMVVLTISNLVANGTMNEQAIDSLAATLSALDRSAQVLNENVDDVIDMLVDLIDQKLDQADLDDWRTLCDSLEEAGWRLTADRKAYFAERAGIFCEEELSSDLLDNAGSREEASGWIEELEGLASAWGHDASSTAASLQGEVDERWPEPDYYDDDGGWGGRRAESDSSDIDDLFDSLRT